MKKSICILILSLMGTVAFADCPNLTKTYHVFVELSGANEGGSYGVARIRSINEMPKACVYQIQSKLQPDKKDLAQPLNGAIQTLTVSKTRGPIGSPFKLENADKSKAAEGSLEIGASQLTFSITFPVPECGGEGGGHNCGRDLILR